MRVNIYSQEIDLDGEPQIVFKDGEGISGKERFFGIRFYLHSALELHATESDDDRSAITFWLPRSEDKRQRIAEMFHLAEELIDEVVIGATKNVPSKGLPPL